MATNTITVSASWTMTSADTNNWVASLTSNAVAGDFLRTSGVGTTTQWFNFTAGALGNLLSLTSITTVNTTTANSLTGGIGVDTISGSSGNDVITGGANADILSGGIGGSDTFVFRRGDSAAGIGDLISSSFTFGSTALTTDMIQIADMSMNGFSATAATATNGFSISYNVGDTIVISSGATVVTARVTTTDKTFNLIVNNTAAAAAVTGTATADYIVGSNAVALGAAGETIDGGGGADTLMGANGDDVMKYYAATAVYNGGAGFNTVTATTEIANVFLGLYQTQFTNIQGAVGGSGNDLLIGASSNDTLNGGAGNDNLWAYTGNDSLIGGVGADTYWFGTADGHDTLTAVAEVDVYKMYNSTIGSLSFSQIGGADMLVTVTGTDDLRINAYSYATGVQQVNTFQTTDKTFNLITDIGATNLMGNNGNDYMLSTGGVAVTLDGGASGDDTLKGGAGNDSLVFRGVTYTAANQGTDLALVNGGAGTDTLSAASNTTGVFIGTYQSKFSSIEYVLGGSGADLLIGSSGVETLVGGAGNDNIWGYTGNDVLTGGTGADTYWFATGDGADTITSDPTSNHNDTVILYSWTATNSITATLSGGNLVLTNGSDSLTLANWQNDGDGARVNRFTFGNGSSAVTYSLSNDATTWTRIS